MQVCLLLLRRAPPSIVQLSVGTVMEAYGGHVAAASNHFCCKWMEEPSRKPCNFQLRVVRFARSDRVDLSVTTYFLAYV